MVFQVLGIYMNLSVNFLLACSIRLWVGIYLLKLKTLVIKEIIDTKENGHNEKDKPNTQGTQLWKYLLEIFFSTSTTWNTHMTLSSSA